jgi:tryptophanyl-tRNA synthetase
LDEGVDIGYKLIKYVLAMGFDPKKIKVFIHTEYLDLYKISMYFGSYVNMNQLTSLFGAESLDSSSKVFHRGALQLSSILMLQLEEFGGPQHTLVPVGVDQHPYILLARDVAKKIGLVPPSEVVLPFLIGNHHPLQKMSSSQKGSAIKVTDSEDQIRKTINNSYTGALSTLKGHREYGGLPKICSVFQILRYHHPDTEYVNRIEKKYQLGELPTSDLKSIVADFVVRFLMNLQDKVQQVKEDDVCKVILNKRINSV